MLTNDTELMAALYLGPDSEVALRPDWTDDESPEGWSRLYCYEDVAAGILRLIRERDDFREGNDHWVKMHDREAAARAQVEQERDEARQDFTDCNEDRERACEFERRFEAERDDAQEAAEEYWEAWQDSAVYWKADRDEWKAEAKSLEQELKGISIERDRLREALKRYGAHHPDCALSDSIARLRGAVPCSCGLSDLVA